MVDSSRTPAAFSLGAEELSRHLSPDFDERFRPQDDFYRHINGRWLEETAIPADRSTYSTFSVLRDLSLERVQKLLEEAADPETPQPEPQENSEELSHLREQLGDVYRSFMNRDRIEEDGLSPLGEMLSRIEEARSLSELLEVVGWLNREGVPGIFGCFLWGNPFDPAHYTMFFSQGGIGLPDESYYREERFEETRQRYREYLTAVFQLLGRDPDAAQACYALEERLASEHWEAADCRNVSKTANRRNWLELKESAGGAGAALDCWREAARIPEQAVSEVIVQQPSFFVALGRLLGEVPLEHWKHLLRAAVFRSFAPALFDEAYELWQGFYGKTLRGVAEAPPRWERAVEFSSQVLGEGIGRLYVEKYFPADSRSRMLALVRALEAAYGESISALPWMTDVTREQALEKLSKFRVKIGYPERWRDFSSLRVRDDDVLANARAAAAFYWDEEVAKLGGPRDRNEWHITPQTVNAYYDPSANEIVFPAAILQPPYFDPEGDMAANFGAIGAVIGHEIGHGFDDQGSKFDGDGRLRNWWSEQDRKEFTARTAQLVEQYSELVPEGVDQRVNGELTLGENIGDLGGLGIAWKGYQIFQKQQAAARQQEDGLEGRLSELAGPEELQALRRFFVAWALAWRNLTRPEETTLRLAMDPHSPPEFRCNQVLRNISEFYRAFEVTSEDAMWLDERQRVTIW